MRVQGISTRKVKVIAEAYAGIAEMPEQERPNLAQFEPASIIYNAGSPLVFDLGAVGKLLVATRLA